MITIKIRITLWIPPLSPFAHFLSDYAAFVRLQIAFPAVYADFVRRPMAEMGSEVRDLAKNTYNQSDYPLIDRNIQKIVFLDRRNWKYRILEMLFNFRGENFGLFDSAGRMCSDRAEFPANIQNQIPIFAQFQGSPRPLALSVPSRKNAENGGIE